MLSGKSRRTGIAVANDLVRGLLCVFPSLSSLPPSLPGPHAPISEPASWFAQEVHPHDGQLKAYLRGSFPAVRDVDDIVQESYLRIWKARAVQPIRFAKAFLFQVARRLALDTVRENRASPIVFAEDFVVSRVLASGDNAADAAVEQDILQHLANAVIALPSHYRDVIILQKIQGLPQKDVAVRLGLSTRSVEKYLSRGMARCETYLRDRGIEGFYG